MFKALKSFLRYNSRHGLYYHPTYNSRGEAAILFGWSLNPIGSMYDGKQISLHEPLWLFKRRKRIFGDAGAQRCGRRDDMFAMNRGDGPLPDRWNIGPDGNRTCSYCGSMHFDDLITHCRNVIKDERYSIDGTDKAYKLYVNIPGVVNASQGAIKYYRQHSPQELTQEQRDLFSEAYRLSRERHNANMAKWREEMAAKRA